MKEDLESKLHSIDVFTRDMLDDMRKLSISTSKADMMAHINAWKNNLKTIKKIIEL